MIHIFDCDGVILDSNFLKIEAFANALASVNCPEALLKLAESEFRRNFGRTRLQHFEQVKILSKQNNLELSDSKISSAYSYYQNAVPTLYKNCPLIAETKKFMSNLYADFVCVVSASDEIELREILPKKVSRSRRAIYMGDQQVRWKT